MVVLKTKRLQIRPLLSTDAPFIVALLNDEAFIRYIGDRRVRTEQDAIAYIANGPMASYERRGFGLCAVTRAEDGTAIGLCGLLQRDELAAPDLGFAFLPQFRSHGYAFEAASAVKADAHDRLRLPMLYAIVNADNAPSIRLLERLGFHYERMAQIGPEARLVTLFAAGASDLC